MTDERLRALERAARAEPSHHEARRAFARALLQAGERQRAYFELARLMREGDDQARREVEGWAGTPRPIPPRVRVRRRTLRRLTLSAGDVLRVGATCVLLGAGGHLVALDPVSLEVLWHERPLAPPHHRRAEFLGDEVVFMADSHLVLRHGRSGDETVRIPAPIPAEAEHWGFEVWADLALVHVPLGNGPARRTLAIRLDGQRGGIAWERLLRGWTFPAGRRLLVEDNQVTGDIEVIDPASGARVLGPQHVLPAEAEGRAGLVVAADDEGFVVTESPIDMDDDDRPVVVITERALPSLTRRWSLQVEGREADAALRGAHALVLAHESRRVSLIDRAKGVVLRERPTPALLFVELWSDEAIYVVTGDDRPALLGLDPVTLDPLVTHELGVERRSDHSHIAIVALDGALLAACETPEGVTLVRVEAMP